MLRWVSKHVSLVPLICQLHQIESEPATCDTPGKTTLLGPNKCNYFPFDRFMWFLADITSSVSVIPNFLNAMIGKLLITQVWDHLHPWYQIPGCNRVQPTGLAQFKWSQPLIKMKIIRQKRHHLPHSNTCRSMPATSNKAKKQNTSIEAPLIHLQKKVQNHPLNLFESVSPILQESVCLFGHSMTNPELRCPDKILLL